MTLFIYSSRGYLEGKDHLKTLGNLGTHGPRVFGMVGRFVDAGRQEGQLLRPIAVSGSSGPQKELS